MTLFKFQKRYLVVGREFGQEDLNLKRFRAKDDEAAKKIFSNICFLPEYSFFELTLYRVTFFGTLIYITEDEYTTILRNLLY